MEQNKAEAEMTDNAIASAPAPLKREQAQASTSRTRARLRPRTRQQVAAAKEAPTSVTLSGTGADAGASAASAVIADASRGADTAQLARSNKAPADEQKAYARSAAASKAKRSSAPETAPAAPTDSSRLNSQIVAAVPAPAGMRMVRGRVTDRSSGTALPGVTVTAKGTAVGTSTTADGSFVLLVPKSVETLTFSYIGFKSSEQRISPTDSTVALALVPDSQPLNEVVVVRREPPPAPMSIGALPAGGYKAFQEYLEQELEYPEKALKEGKEGTVKLKFVVAADGSLQDIKVVRGLSEECDAEAIRLLKEGPKWYPAIVKGRRAARPVEVNVPFRVNQ
jgi:TonB family protein